MKSQLVKSISILLLGVAAAALVGGCIADHPEDTNLPWASNNSWEGMAPIGATMMDRYD